MLLVGAAQLARCLMRSASSWMEHTSRCQQRQMLRQSQAPNVLGVTHADALLGKRVATQQQKRNVAPANGHGYVTTA